MSDAHPHLESVDRLTVTFLVDNCIEWMTKLPPEFTSELRLHLSEGHPPIDQATGLPIIDLENYCCGAHGFSVLIETQIEGREAHKTLFDAGPDARALMRNLAALRVDTAGVDRVVLSHWHADHTGGLLAFLAQARARGGAVAVDAHPARPSARGIADAAGRVVARLPADPDFADIERAGGRVERWDGPHVVAGGAVWVSGEIPRVTEFEKGMEGAVRWREGVWEKEEHIMDERFAVVDVAGKGLVIFSACSHAGIVNVVKHAIATFSKPVYMIMGGLHLAGPEFADRIPDTVKYLSQTAPTYVLPMHCSGFQVKVALEHVLGNGCVPAGVGVRVQVISDRCQIGK